MTQPYIVENDAGERKAWNGQDWVTIGNKNAPGSAYLSAPVGKPDKSEAAYFNKFRTDDNPGVAGARTGVQKARQMEGLLAKQETGGIYGVPVIGSVAGWLDPEIREMDSIQAEAARSKRQPGEGAISDFDAQQFLTMTYGKDKPTTTNKALIQAQRVADDARIQRRQFLEWHYNTFGRASGAEEAWDRYASDNPIFSAASEAAGEPKLNAGRSNWRQYFGVVRGEGDKTATQAQQDIQRPPPGGKPKPMGWSQQLPPKQLAAAKMFAGSKAKPGDRGNPFLPTDMDEFKKLPPGAWVLDDDGTVFQKGKR